MPRDNRFQHQSYPAVPVLKAAVSSLSVKSEKPVDFGRLHDEFGIHHVELVHGTFAGSDPFGVNAILKMLAEETSRPLRVPLKLVIDKLSDSIRNVSQRVTGSVANYNEDYGRNFQELVGGADADPLVSRLSPTWSSENNHLARAELAVRLLCRLDDLKNQGLNPADERVMLWGYSHAAAGLALLTNLLANHRPSVDSFFEAAEDSLGELGRRARAILAAERSPHSLAKCLVLVTFGGPVRYGWDTDGYRYLMHVIHHRAFDENEPTRSVPAVQFGCAGKGVRNNLEAVSGGLLDILNARHGD